MAENTYKAMNRIYVAELNQLGILFLDIMRYAIHCEVVAGKH